MLIGEDYISNDVITLGACFQVFFTVCLHSPSFRFPLIGGNLTAQSTWSHRGIVDGIQVPETYTSPSLNPVRPPERSGELSRRLSIRRTKQQ